MIRKTSGKRPLKLLFVSYHCLADTTSGAAIATIDLLHLLSEKSWMCGAICGPVLDCSPPDSVVEYLSQRGEIFERLDAERGRETDYSLLGLNVGTLPVRVFWPVHQHQPPGKAEGMSFLRAFRAILREQRPDLVLAYGGDWVTQTALRDANRAMIKTVFALHNFSYQDQSYFSSVDGVFVPSRVCAEYYERTLGLHCHVLPSPIIEEKVKCAPIADAQYVTFVNPSPHKGVYFFARIAHALEIMKPDIPLLVVEGRAGIDWLLHASPSLIHCQNVHRMTNTGDPREIYQVSRIVLVPSLWKESFGRVAAEAMLNGIPVLGSDRGALPEVIGDAGFVFSIPERYTPATRLLPTHKEVSPWVECIIDLWDDERRWAVVSQRCVDRAKRWRSETVAQQHDEWLRLIATGATGAS